MAKELEFRCELTYPQFKSFITFPKKLGLDETRIVVTKNGLSCKLVNRPLSVLGHMYLPISILPSFEHKSDVTIVVDVAKLETVEKIDSASNILMEKYVGADILSLKIDNIRRKIPLLSDMNTIPQLPVINTTVSLVISADEIKKILPASKTISTDVQLRSDGETFTIHSGDFNDTMDMSLDAKECSLEGSADTVYQLSYIASALELTTEDDIVSLAYGDNLPLMLDYGNENGEYKYAIAPIITQD